MQARALSSNEVDRWLSEHPAWTVVTSPRRDEPEKARTELTRVFRCATFADALAFMQAAAPFIEQTDHHPRWENTYRTVTVWLSTWSLGHTVSTLDLALADHLDAVFNTITPAPERPD